MTNNNFESLNNICPVCKIASVGDKFNQINTSLMSENFSYYTGSDLTTTEINNLSNMCGAAKKMYIGTYFSYICKLAKKDSSLILFKRICCKPLYDLIANSALPVDGLDDRELDPVLKEAGYTGIEQLGKYYLDYMNKFYSKSYTNLNQFDYGQTYYMTFFNFFPKLLTQRETNPDILTWMLDFQYRPTDTEEAFINDGFCGGFHSVNLGTSITNWIDKINEATCVDRADILIYNLPGQTTNSIDQDKKNSIYRYEK